MKTKPTEKFNVQKRCEEIHAQYGTSEMANYRIQQMCDKIAQDAFNEGRRSVIDNTSKPRLDKFTLGIIPERFDEKVWNTETNFNEKKYNDWLRSSVDVLKKIYDKMDDFVDASDLYILGDLVNMLDNTIIKLKKH